MSKDLIEELRKPITYNFKLSSRLENRFETHMQVLKQSNPQHKRKNWLNEAISEKVKKYSTAISKGFFLSLKINKQLLEMVSERISGTAYSKKKWIIEAIEEKLDREKLLLKQLQED